MALLRMKDISNMDFKERITKLQELRLELVKANVAARKSGTKTKEIKKAIARLMTFQHAAKQEELNN